MYRFLTGWTIALLLTACGFQLRGAAQLPYETFFVEGSNPAVTVDLSRAIQSGGNTRIVGRAQDAQAVLQILGEMQEKRILSLSGAGRVREYQLLYKISFRIRDREGRELIAPQQIELRRELSYDDTQVLAKEGEEALLYRDMQRDAVFQIIRRLNAAKPLAAETTESSR